jgi:ABC-type uncharacterized transport system involved in gliding motility auxiliary subunit
MSAKWFQRYWKIIFLLGPILLIMGISAGLVAGTWDGVPLGLVIAGIVIIVLWVLVQWRESQGFWSRRSTEAGTNAIVSTVAVLVILGLINYLGVRYSVRFDLTEAQQFTLAPQSRQIVREAERNIKLWVFYPEPTSQDLRLLENYDRVGGENFSYELIDPTQQPQLVREFEVQQIGDVYLEIGDRRQLVQNIRAESLSEEEITNTLIQLISDRQPTVYFIQGHGERPIDTEAPESLSRIIGRLENQNYRAEPLNLAEGDEIPEDAAAIAIANPDRELFDAEIDKLEDYLQQGGGLLVMVDPDKDPGLSELLDNWGITLNEGLAIDPDRWVQGYGPSAPLIIEYGTHPITREFGQGYSLYRLARPIEIEEREQINATPLLFTSENSWLETTPGEEEPDWEYHPTRDRKGPLVLGVALSREVSPETSETEEQGEDADETTEAESETATPSPDAESDADTSDTEETTESEEATETPSPDAESDTDTSDTEETPEESDSETEEDTKEARLVVFGDSDFATNGYLAQLNGDVFLNAMTWVAQQDEDRALSIRPQTVENRRLNITPPQGRLLVVVALIVFPVLGFASSAIVWWRRR